MIGVSTMAMTVFPPNYVTQVTLIDDGVTYAFNDDGQLTSVTRAEDDGGRSSPNYSFSGPTANPSAMTDPVSGRSITFTYVRCVTAFDRAST